LFLAFLVNQKAIVILLIFFSFFKNNLISELKKPVSSANNYDAVKPDFILESFFFF